MPRSSTALSGAYYFAPVTAKAATVKPTPVPATAPATSTGPILTPATSKPGPAPDEKAAAAATAPVGATAPVPAAPPAPAALPTPASAKPAAPTTGIPGVVAQATQNINKAMSAYNKLSDDQKQAALQAIFDQIDPTNLASSIDSSNNLRNFLKQVWQLSQGEAFDDVCYFANKQQLAKSYQKVGLAG
jgi:hypothetical protein